MGNHVAILTASLCGKKALVEITNICYNPYLSMLCSWLLVLHHTSTALDNVYYQSRGLPTQLPQVLSVVAEGVIGTVTVYLAKIARPG